MAAAPAVKNDHGVEYHHHPHLMVAVAAAGDSDAPSLLAPRRNDLDLVVVLQDCCCYCETHAIPHETDSFAADADHCHDGRRLLCSCGLWWWWLGRPSNDYHKFHDRSWQ